MTRPSLRIIRNVQTQSKCFRCLRCPMRAAMSSRRELATNTKSTTFSSSTKEKHNRRFKVRHFILPSAIVASGVYWAYDRLFPPQEVLDGTSFISAKVHSITSLSPTTSLFRLKLPSNIIIPDTFDNLRPIVSLSLVQPNAQITRDYTPLNIDFLMPNVISDDRIIELAVKKYEDGEVSKWMHRVLGVGSDVLIRAPLQTLRVPENLEHLVFIAGGTGITPAYQILDDLSKHQQRQRHLDTYPLKITLIYSSVNQDEILLSQELQQFQSTLYEKHTFDLHFLVDDLKTGHLSQNGVSQQRHKISKIGRISFEDLQKWIGNANNAKDNTLILVCGPDGMINAVSGPWGRGRTQGQIGGYLASLGWSEKNVRKL